MALNQKGTIMTNVIGTKNLLDFCVSHSVSRFLFASTVEVYGENRGDVDKFTEDYCGYIDTNNMPELANFIEDNDIGEFTGLTKRSGFCEYPLYLFNPEKLRELCPDGMEAYERSIGATKAPEMKEKAR